MATCEWNPAIPAAVFKDDEGRIVLCVLTRPSNAILAAWETMYPGLPIREGLDEHFPAEDS